MQLSKLRIVSNLAIGIFRELKQINAYYYHAYSDYHGFRLNGLYADYFCLYILLGWLYALIVHLYPASGYLYEDSSNLYVRSGYLYVHSGYLYAHSGYLYGQSGGFFGDANKKNQLTMQKWQHPKNTLISQNKNVWGQQARIHNTQPKDGNNRLLMFDSYVFAC